jgi:uncharacterized protein (DUF58 family)
MRTPRTRATLPAASPPAWRPTAIGAFLAAQAVAVTAAPWWLPEPGAAVYGVALLAMLGLSAVAVRRSLAGIAAAWVPPGVLRAHEEALVPVRAVLPPGAPPCTILVLDAGQRRWRTALAAPAGGGAAQAAVPVRFDRRGVHRLGPILATGLQPFGLVRAARTVGGDQEVLVLPARGRVPPDLDAHLDALADGRRAALIAGDEDVDRLRALLPGESLRLVHWPTTARVGQPMVIDRVATARQHIAVLVDLRACGQPGERRWEHVVVAAATLCEHLAGRGWDVGLRLATGPVPGSAARHVEALALVDVAAAAGPPEPPGQGVALLLTRLPPEPPLRAGLIVLDGAACDRIAQGRQP